MLYLVRNPRKLDHPCASVFETTIRFVGGLLSAYMLNGEKDAILLTKAQEVANKLAFAWVGTNDIPFGELNFTTNQPVIQTVRQIQPESVEVMCLTHLCLVEHCGGWHIDA